MKERLRQMHRPNPHSQPTGIEIDTVVCQEPDRVKIIEQMMSDPNFLDWYPGKDGPVDHEAVRERLRANQKNQTPGEYRVWEAD